MLRSLSRASSIHLGSTVRTTRTMSSQPDYYVAVHADGSLAASSSSSPAAASSSIPKLWKASRAQDKAGETRTFYALDGDSTVVAVGVGKPKDRKGGEGEENALKEQTRRTVSLLSQLDRMMVHREHS